eukprot:scaffold109968_cov31-Tisochrysis_lutea.AAC.1
MARSERWPGPQRPRDARCERAVSLGEAARAKACTWPALDTCSPMAVAKTTSPPSSRTSFPRPNTSCTTTSPTWASCLPRRARLGIAINR